MKNECNELLLSLIEVNYNKNNFNYNDIDPVFINCLIKKASINGLEYLISNTLSQKGIISKPDYADNLKKLINTINILNEVSKELKIEYIIIKDCNTIPHIPRDIDIFIRENDKDQMIETLKKYNLIIESSNPIETALISSKTLPLDIYTKIIYFGHEFLDENFLFDSITERKFFGIDYPGLNYESEYLLTLLHGLFGHRRLTLLDFLHLNKIKDQKLNTYGCLEYVKKKGWLRSYYLMNNKFNLIQKDVFDGKCTEFPYLFDIKFVLDCITNIDDIDFNLKDKILIIYSLLLDGIKLKVENSSLNEFIKKHERLRKTLLSLAYRSRTMRKDKYS